MLVSGGRYNVAMIVGGGRRWKLLVRWPLSLSLSHSLSLSLALFLPLFLSRPSPPPLLSLSLSLGAGKRRTPLGPYRRPRVVLWWWAFSSKRGTPVRLKVTEVLPSRSAAVAPSCFTGMHVPRS